MHLTLKELQRLDPDLRRRIEAAAGNAKVTPVADTSYAPDWNKTEERYAQHLQAMLERGLLASWAYDEEKFRLAKRCWYSPDFRIVEANGRVWFADVKGTKKSAQAVGERFVPYVREDAMIKLRLANALHPYEFCIVYRVGQTWRVRKP